MKKLILAGTFVLAATAAQAQYLGTGSNPNSHPVRAYTTAGPAGAGVYREEPLQTNPNSTRADKTARGARQPSGSATRDTEQLTALPRQAMWHLRKVPRLEP
jgi:hypothetical protein